MKTDLKQKPRKFKLKDTVIKDYGKIFLENGEMVSFVTKSGKECDFNAFDWGFYLGPSLNGRLKNEGFKTALVLNEAGRIYINAVEKEKIEEFKKYLTTNQNNKILCWLDEWLADSNN
ncbi:hypothetical protein KA977_01570 [Candidatus Dependentiae bacterium]|nr:hypothetical protein [Candidatus Dependentiae bacterium]